MLISQIMGMSETSQQDLQELIERAMIISSQQNDAHSDFNQTIASHKVHGGLSPRAREILEMHERLSEMDQEAFHLREQLAIRDKTIRTLEENERRLRLELEASPSYLIDGETL